MSIVDDYETLGANYAALTDGWIPREEKKPAEPLSFDEQMQPLTDAIESLYTKALGDIQAEPRGNREAGPVEITILDKAPRKAKIDIAALKERDCKVWTTFGQRVFERYFGWANRWVNHEDWFGFDTGLSMVARYLNIELTKIEDAGLQGINTNDRMRFRSEIVQFALRFKAQTGNMPNWHSNFTIKEMVQRYITAHHDEYWKMYGEKRAVASDNEPEYDKKVVLNDQYGRYTRQDITYPGTPVAHEFVDEAKPDIKMEDRMKLEMTDKILGDHRQMFKNLTHLNPLLYSVRKSPPGHVPLYLTDSRTPAELKARTKRLIDTGADDVEDAG